MKFTIDKETGAKKILIKGLELEWLFDDFERFRDFCDTMRYISTFYNEVPEMEVNDYETY